MSSSFRLHSYQQRLVDKSRKEIANGHKGVLIVSPPGSGKSVVIAEIARLTTEKGGRVLFIVHRRELINQIKGSFKRQGVNMDLVDLYTPIRARNRLKELNKPALIVTDESHHSKAKSYREIYDFFEDVVHLGFTATPWRLSGEGFTDVFDVMIEGQSVQWLIDNEFLAPFEYWAPTLADVKALKRSSMGDFTKKSIDEALGNTIFGDVVKHYKKLADGQQAIAYAHSVEASKEIARAFNAEGVEARHADAKTPDKEREQIMVDFKSGKIKVLSNVDLVSEGFDVPECSCVILARPTASLVYYLQQSMRAMRYRPNKKATIIDHVGNHIRHGLPSTPRDWEIGSREKQSRKQTEALTPTKTCPDCFAVVMSKIKECDFCGHEFQGDPQEKKKKEMELKKIEFHADYRNISIAQKDNKELKTIEELVIYQKMRGFKFGWVYFQARKKGLLNEYYKEIKHIKEKINNV